MIKESLLQQLVQVQRTARQPVYVERPDKMFKNSQGQRTNVPFGTSGTGGTTTAAGTTTMFDGHYNSQQQHCQHF